MLEDVSQVDADRELAVVLAVLDHCQACDPGSGKQWQKMRDQAQALRDQLRTTPTLPLLVRLQALCWQAAGMVNAHG